jgi:long-subunit acyl-CoA synthetase (AMP-forming)
MKGIICTEDKVSYLSQILKNESSKVLKYIIVIDDISNPNGPLAEGATHKFSDIIKLGKEKTLPDVIAEPDTILTIVYTSGTTGSPKGALISHNNACSGSNMLVTRYFFYFLILFFFIEQQLPLPLKKRTFHTFHWHTSSNV